MVILIFRICDLQLTFRVPVLSRSHSLTHSAECNHRLPVPSTPLLE